MMDVEAPSRRSRPGLGRYRELASIAAGVVFVAASFTPLFHTASVSLERSLQKGRLDCSGWTNCAGRAAFYPFDVSHAVKWLTLFGALVALTVPAIRLLFGRTGARWTARLQRLAGSGLVVATVAVLGLVTLQYRSVEYEERIHQYRMQPTWACAVMVIAAAVIMTSAWSSTPKARNPNQP